MNEENKSKETNESELEKVLTYKSEFAWNQYSDKQKNQARDLASKYLNFLKSARTERERVDFFSEIAIRNGFKRVEIGEGDHSLEQGDKVFYVNRNKNIAFVKIGKNPMTTRVNLLGAHVDTPRIDLKIKPLYEDKESGVALLKTHYYGGIKKYQWATIPLALTGVVIKPDGTKIKVEIGLDHDDPVFMIPDLLPHLNKNVQSERKTKDVIKAEEMNVLAGATEIDDDKAKNKFKLHVLKILNEKYDITESDFYSAELSLVSALPPRYIGVDKALIGSPGQDDGVCAFTAFNAIMNIDETPENTIITALFDKEEIGSSGNTGAQSSWIRFLFNDLMVKTLIPETMSNLSKTLQNTKILSTDVTAPLDPTFKSVHDPKTAGILGKGIIIMKYTGHGGKYNASDATAEYVAQVRSIFEKENVPYQFGTLGAVDAGGGGTIAKFFAQGFNADVIDGGPGVLNMHSPYEITHIADVYSAHLAYTSFLNAK